MRGLIWTHAEKIVLQDNYTKSTPDELSEMLPGRSWEAIKIQAAKLQLKKSISLKNPHKAVPFEQILASAKLNSVTNCLLLTTHSNGKSGHTRIKQRGKSIMAHRAAWQYHYKTILPNDVIVRHKCNVPNCINVDHLMLGNHADNVSDQNLRVTKALILMEYEMFGKSFNGFTLAINKETFLVDVYYWGSLVKTLEDMRKYIDTAYSNR